MADDEALEITEETKKDREEAEQAKALNAVTDNVSSSCSSRAALRHAVVHSPFMFSQSAV